PFLFCFREIFVSSLCKKYFIVISLFFSGQRVKKKFLTAFPCAQFGIVIGMFEIRDEAALSIFLLEKSGCPVFHVTRSFVDNDYSTCAKRETQFLQLSVQ